MTSAIGVAISTLTIASGLKLQGNKLQGRWGQVSIHTKCRL